MCSNDLIKNIIVKCNEEPTPCFGVSADISHINTNSTIDRHTEGFERFVADYERFRLGYQLEEFNFKDHYPDSLKGIHLRESFNSLFFKISSQR